MRQFGLIGFPLTHSFSGNYFAEKFAKEKITDAEYSLFPLEKIELLPELIATHPNLLGLNVTIPYKEKVIPFLAGLDEIAQAVGAVNTIKISSLRSQISNLKSQVSLKGYNTDVHGFRQSIKPFLTSSHERALILGTGGSSKAVEYVLKQIGVECIFVSREKKNVPGKTILTYEEVNSYVLSACKLLVNCSSLGTFPGVNAFPAIPYEYITPQHFCYDLAYNPAKTEFLKRAKTQGAEIMNGLDMLKMQAEKAWEIWNLPMC